MTKTIISFKAVMTVLFWPGLSWAHEGNDGHHMSNMMDGWNSMMVGGGFLVWLTWSIVGILLVIWLIKQINKN